jgi:glycosyltransferase involved in cell wall biosynthesis
MPVKDAPLQSLSVAIVCCNNRDTIARVLHSIKGLANEVVAVDSGSIDGTLELLEDFNATIIRTDWKGHVATKQQALEACSCEWTLCLDSDEPVEPDLRAAIIEQLRDGAVDDDITGMRVNRKVWYCPFERGGANGRFLEHVWQPEWRLRLVRRGCAAWTGLDPHDKLELSRGHAINLAGTLRHDSFGSFDEQLAKQITLGRIMAKSLAKEGRRGSYLRLLISPALAFLKQLIAKQGFRDGRAGWMAAGAAASAALTKHIMLLELDEAAANAPTTDARRH